MAVTFLQFLQKKTDKFSQIITIIKTSFIHFGVHLVIKSILSTHLHSINAKCEYLCYRKHIGHGMLCETLLKEL